MTKIKGVSILVLLLSAGAAGFLYLKKGPGPGATASPSGDSGGRAAATGKSAFVGDSGYLMEFPSGYEVYAEMRGKSEIVYFFPKGTRPTDDERQYKAAGIVRLEVSRPPEFNGKRATLEDLKKGVQYALRNNKETFTLKDVAMRRTAFQVNILLPVEITQLFVDGTGVFYSFTGADEAFMYSLAESIKETGAARLPGAP
ncbi:MAG: hypothetical protein PHV36_03745 [Elusimicrobiales bacterium]|nr:hypothetical protein [Elusimicrobiales bacterium]